MRVGLAYRVMAMSTTPTRPVVIQLVNSLALAGAEHVAVSLATHLDPERWDVRMIVVRDGPLRHRLEEAGVHLTADGVWGCCRVSKGHRSARCGATPLPALG